MSNADRLTPVVHDQTRWLPLTLAVIALVGITLLGIPERRWMWNETTSARFVYDINRNFNFGRAAIDDGFLNVYDKQVRDDPPTDKKLDYPPLRLATFAAWVAWTRWHHPEIKHWSADYAVTAPLMNYNSTLEWIASLAAFLITWYWLRACMPNDRLYGCRRPQAWTGLLPAISAFTLLWLNPAIVLIAHGWPSPNIWVIPFYLWTVLFCLCDRWFVAGIVMGIGAMMQGQQLLVTAVFALWPLFAGRPSRALRWASGFLFTFTLIASGWLLTRMPGSDATTRQCNWPALCWVFSSTGLLAALSYRGLFAQYAGHRFERRARSILPTITAMNLIWPAMLSRDLKMIAAAVLIASAVVLVFLKASNGWKRYLLPLAVGICLLLCVPLFGGDTAWWRIGFVYGTERFPNVGGQLVNNLPTLLERFFGWHDIHDVAFMIPEHVLFRYPLDATAVTVRILLLTTFYLMLVACSAAIAFHWRRKNRELLVALVLPWLLFFTVLPQMSPRYSVFIAGVGAICIGYSVGSYLLIVFLSFLTIVQTATCMIEGNYMTVAIAPHDLFDVRHLRLLKALNPGISWAEVLAAGVVVFITFLRPAGFWFNAHSVGGDRNI